MNESEVTQMLRDAIDQDPKGRVWHVNTKHLVAFAHMVADKTRREMSSPTKVMGPNLEEVLNSAGFYRKATITTQEEFEAKIYKNYNKEDQEKWDEYIYEQGEVKSKEEQKKADEAAWSEDRNVCAAIRDAALDAAGENAALVTAAYSNYTVACLAIDDHWDAVKAKREGRGQELEVRECKKHPNAPHGFLRNASHNEGRYVCECEHWKENT
jgi:hypothetical protein